MSAGDARKYFWCHLVDHDLQLSRPVQVEVMRGRSRASPVALELDAWASILLYAIFSKPFRLRRDTAVVLHGRSPKWRLMIDPVIREPAPNSTMTRSRNECRRDLSRHPLTFFVCVATHGRSAQRADRDPVDMVSAGGRKVGNWRCARSMSYGVTKYESVGRLGSAAVAMGCAICIARWRVRRFRREVRLGNRCVRRGGGHERLGMLRVVVARAEYVDEECAFFQVASP